MGLGILTVPGCATVGRDFPVAGVYDIAIGETTQTDVRETFGAPWRVGLENGETTWTYGRYRYRLFGERSTTDLVVRFDASGIVTSYAFSTTEHDEGKSD
ncbi:MAG: outer membrane protein assembly factor BamE [Candidatus Eisenbacteria bacterium]